MPHDESRKNIHIDGSATGGVYITGNGNTVQLGPNDGPDAKPESPSQNPVENPAPLAASSDSPLIFLCHADEDKPKVENLYQRLKNAGYEPWMDAKNVLGGQGWDYQVRHAMNSAAMVLVCLSKVSVRKRGYLNKEIKWALDRQDEMLPGDIFTIPVKLEVCELPDHLSGWQAVDLFAADGFDRLKAALDHQFNRLGISKISTESQKVFGPNPFHYGGAVPTRLFYGRREILNAVRTRIGGRELQSISIVGERRMGKSSLLQYVKSKLVEELPEEYRHIVIYLDLMRAYCHTRKGLMRALRRQLTKAWREPWEKAEDGDLSAFDFALEDMEDENIRLILCLDEMENLTKRKEEFDDLLEDWRACGQMGQMAFVTASARPLADLCKSGGLTSPFFNIFSQNYLGLLEPAEWTALVTDHMSANPEELNVIEEIAGGHPFFTQMAAFALWEMEVSRNVDYELLREHMAAEMRPHFQYGWERMLDTERSALRYFSGKAAAKPEPAITGNLTARGWLKQGSPFSQTFSDFIQKQ
jgi:hypothetical protein